jgi:hypothetical protein
MCDCARLVQQLMNRPLPPTQGGLFWRDSEHLARNSL